MSHGVLDKAHGVLGSVPAVHGSALVRMDSTYLLV